MRGDRIVVTEHLVAEDHIGLVARRVGHERLVPGLGARRDGELVERVVQRVALPRQRREAGEDDDAAHAPQPTGQGFSARSALPAGVQRAENAPGVEKSPRRQRSGVRTTARG